MLDSEYIKISELESKDYWVPYITRNISKPTTCINCGLEVDYSYKTNDWDIKKSIYAKEMDATDKIMDAIIFNIIFYDIYNINDRPIFNKEVHEMYYNRITKFINIISYANNIKELEELIMFQLYQVKTNIVDIMEFYDKLNEDINKIQNHYYDISKKIINKNLNTIKNNMYYYNNNSIESQIFSFSGYDDMYYIRNNRKINTDRLSKIMYRLHLNNKRAYDSPYVSAEELKNLQFIAKNYFNFVRDININLLKQINMKTLFTRNICKIKLEETFNKTNQFSLINISSQFKNRNHSYNNYVTVSSNVTTSAMSVLYEENDIYLYSIVSGLCKTIKSMFRTNNKYDHVFKTKSPTIKNKINYVKANIKISKLDTSTNYSYLKKKINTANNLNYQTIYNIFVKLNNEELYNYLINDNNKAFDTELEKNKYEIFQYTDIDQIIDQIYNNFNIGCIEYTTNSTSSNPDLIHQNINIDVIDNDDCDLISDKDDIESAIIKYDLDKITDSAKGKNKNINDKFNSRNIISGYTDLIPAKLNKDIFKSGV